MDVGAGLHIRPLAGHEIAAAVALCARGMSDNPLHLRVFGADSRQRQRRLQRFFSSLLPFIQRKGTLVAAVADGVPVGLFGRLPPGACRPGMGDLLRLALRVAVSTTPAVLLRLQRWLNAWAASDPAEPHWHLGPLVVDPAWQGRGIGSRLMRQCIDDTRASGASLYLETDKPVNVRFYERFGFTTRATLSVLDTPNWLMARAPAPDASAQAPGEV